jgi:hypothetical protein
VNYDKILISAIIVGLAFLAYEFFTAPEHKDENDDGDERPG